MLLVEHVVMLEFVLAIRVIILVLVAAPQQLVVVLLIDSVLVRVQLCETC